MAGGTSGIGLAIARNLEQRRISTLAISNDAASGSLLGSSSTVFEALDLSDPGAVVIERVTELLQQYGAPKYLFMSIGLTREERALETTVEQWEVLAHVNLLGVIYLCNTLAQEWRDRPIDPWARQIIMMGSVNAFRPLSSQGAYSVMKAGLHAYAKCLANDLAADKVRVNVIAPGAIWTPMNEALFADDLQGYAQRKVTAASLSARWGQAEEVASVAAWLALESPSFVNGAELTIDGGHLVQR